MLLLDFNDHEKQILKALIEDVLSDLRMEIIETDSTAFRKQLYERKQILDKLIIRLESNVSQ